ncbi:glycoside hydrolase family 2 [Rhizobium sp. P38BS-XIX]|uniref:glycoside hydrolase family 2 protein n=1 Tax=Rhizobium sp. P38BS-XIX TaxID=2726740 RepID=UPI0014574A9A|nr:sugar-binding domain-containing protein [Rhizobium sp. P38BS-XIX]NLR99839.1 glycoside hydrolase family 2 [Rhizobium sp. P38BS-XIX]
MTIASRRFADTQSGRRARLSLDGTWDFQLDGQQPTTIAVPAPWQAHFPDLRAAAGTAIYSRKLSVPQEWLHCQVIVHFGAVNYFAEVSVNGRFLGAHEGGYLPFELVIPADLLAGELSLDVKVTLPSADAQAFPDFPFDEIPHGKQSWYGMLGGIWQSVWLECRNEAHIAHQAIRADLATGAVAIDVELAAAFSGTLNVKILDRNGAIAASTELGLENADVASAALKIEKVEAWSLDDPALYRAVLELSENGIVIDAAEETFGFRTFEAKEGKFFLNGQPFYMRGALDQDYYPEGIYTPPSLEFLEDQARKSKELGLNLLRCHIKVPDPRYYDVADRFGLLVWTEIPNIQTFTEKSARRLLDTMEGTLRRDGNHPSIVIWTIINEDWGTRLVESADQRAWLDKAYHWLKAKDPARLVVDNSACIPNFHVVSDIDDYHYYASVPEMAREWAEWVSGFAKRPDWSYSPNGDAKRRGDEPLVVSEFGVWGLPHPDKLLQDGKEPFWFINGLEWDSEGATYPHGVQQRFRTYQFDKVFPSFDSFIEDAQWHQFNALKFEIEEMRRHASIQGYVITELTDLHWEANGLMDMERNTRAYHNRFHEINSDVVIVPRMQRYAVWAGDTTSVELEISTGGQAIPTAAELTWSIDGGSSGKIAVEPLEATSVSQLSALALTFTEDMAGKQVAVQFTLTAGGREIARNSLDVSVYAARRKPTLAVSSAEPDIVRYLTALGYNVVGAEKADVCVASSLDQADIDALEHGARYVSLADTAPLPFGNLRSDQPNWNYPTGGDRGQPMPQMRVTDRNGTIWKGNWVTGFSWVKRSGAFERLPGGPLTDLSFVGVNPNRVITGFRPIHFDGLVHAGTMAGWIHKPCATIAERQLGAGHIVATTFGLMREPAGLDPVAATLLDCIIETAAA